MQRLNYELFSNSNHRTGIFCKIKLRLGAPRNFLTTFMISFAKVFLVKFEILIAIFAIF